jgi:succinyl-CoA synthetase beta subunit
MNIHEYQAKQLFDRFGVPTPKGAGASSPEEAEKIATELRTSCLIVKAQIHAGGRGKGVFKTGFKGGVHLCSTPGEARALAEKMLGQVLVTHQTGPEGKVVRKVLVAESVDIAREIYFAILMDRHTGAPILVASTEGGVEIEKVAEEHPEKIYRESVHPLLGFEAFQALKIGRKLGFSGKQLRAAAKLFSNVFTLFSSLDCSLVEINPLVQTPSGDILALDAKFNFDDNALYRHPEIVAMRDVKEEDPREVAASEHNLNYVGLDGNIACLVNGAGLAMATMDIIKYAGGEPANFLDVGGGASEEQVTEAFKILISDKNVRAILVNIFGGIMRCDVIAQGIINAVKATSLPVPLVVRLEGTNVDVGKKLLEDSKLPIQAAPNLAEAARRVVAAAKAISK